MIARHLLVLIALASCAWATSCTFDEKANASKGCGNCPAGMCYFGFCVAPSPGSPGAGGSGGVQPGGGAGGDQIATGTSGQSAGNGGTGVTSGMSGGAGTTPGGAGGNSGGGGGSTPTGMCPDQRTPEAESCNGKDDDCDGKTDEDLTLGSCAGTNSNGCGGVMRCQGGKTVCDANAGPTTEICNGLDDDCDGVVDNDSDVPCYPDGQTGCTKNAAGSYDCKGSCKAGMALCQSGKLAACADFVTPTAEQCGQAEAADEDCNGMVDDGCPCSGNQTQGCYSGPALTRRVGTCKAGTQHCVNSVFGPCQGEVTPVGESCSNEGADDDCNGFRDDIFLRGVFCVAFAAQGACASGSYGCTGSDYVCQPGAAQAKETSCDQVDEDCDGKTDEDFDFDTDPNNCGSCGNKCAAGNLCCGGTCRDIGSDAQHCGSCARVCGTDTLCCAGDCVATNTNMHCGSCTGCSGGQTCCGGSCMTTGAAAPCGTCNPCAGTDLCCNGQCVPSGAGTCNACTPCPSDQLCCSGMCITPAADAGAVCP